jgi:elongation factor 1 alpha-like protein
MIGLAEVKSMIGERKINDEDIKDALWHYDFDSQRAAKYVSDKYDKANKPKPKAKPAAQTAAKGMLESKGVFDQNNVSKALSGEPTKTSKLASLAKSRTAGNDSNSNGNDNSGNGASSKLAALAKTRSSQNEVSGSSSKLADLAKKNNSGTGGLKSVNLLGRLSSTENSSASSSGSALDKLRQRRSETPTPRSPSPSTITSTTEKVKKKPPPPALKKLPDIDFDYNVAVPEIIRGTPSSFGTLFCDRSANSRVSRVANTVYLPVDSTKVKEAFNKPSPDDVVLSAQEKGGFASSASATTIEKDINDLSISSRGSSNTSASSVKNVRKLDVDQELSKANIKPTINFVVIGHVDAGKSTLMGRLLYDSGAVDPKIIKKYEEESKLKGKGSFALAWVLDQTEEERRRGVTMDICVSSFETNDAKFTIVDAPGHKDFVPNMIAGSAQADFAVLVVDAATNAFESGFSLDGQTKEHAVLVRSLGVDSVVVAVNKLDTVDWQQERFDEIRIQLSEFLKKIGFKEQQVSFIPTSGLYGDNVAKPSKTKNLSWYQGNTLLKQLELNNEKSEKKDHKKDLRIITSDVVKGANTTDMSIIGRVETGSIQVGEKVHISPSGKIAPVKSLMSNGEKKNWAIAGDNITANLGELENDDALVGDVVCNLESPIPSAKRFTCRVVVFDLKRPITLGTRFIVHRGRINAPAKISKIVATLDKSNGQVLKNKPRHLTSNQTAVVEVLLEDRAIPLEQFKASKELGRIVLRKDGSTMAAGVVDDIIE